MSAKSDNHVTSFTGYEEDRLSGDYASEIVRELLSEEFDRFEETEDSEYEIKTSVGSTAVVSVLEGEEPHSSLDLEDYNSIIEISGAEPVVNRARNYLEKQLR